MKMSDYIAQFLAQQGIRHAFAITGGASIHMIHSIAECDDIDYICPHHEQGGAMAADAYARATGKVGVCFGTSGPGATNLVTGIATAQMDSVPMVVITGQVPRPAIGTDAFQEADTSGITRQATKHNYLVRHVDDLARVLHEAFHVATHGRPGPVLVDIPKDVILGEAPYLTPKKVQNKTYNPQTVPDKAGIEEAINLLAVAKRPIIYAGGGVINAGPAASARLERLVHATGFP